jgi:hypothetical protein
MDLDHIGKILDPSKDKDIDNLSEDSLEKALTDMITFFGIEKKEFLKHSIRNLRRRILYSLIPAKVLRERGTGRQFDIKEDIIKIIEKRTKIPSLEIQDLRLVTTVRKLSVDLTDTRDNFPPDIEIDLIKRDGNRCQLCGYKFRKTDTNDIRLKELFADEMYYNDYDDLKPLSFKPSLRHPTIDHVIPISSFGTNRMENLQILCEQCNQGKVDYLNYSETREASGFRRPSNIDKLKLHHTEDRALFYAIMERDRKCSKCGVGSSQEELTITPKDSDIFFLFDNLEAVCYKCDKYDKRWKKRIGKRI